MSIVTRLLNRLRIDCLDRDLHEEVQFHLELRATHHQQAGLNREDAMKRAREQFGDVETAKKGMRRARLSSVATLVTITAIAGVLVVSVARNRGGSDDVHVPALPAAPFLLYPDSIQKSPPPPPPPPPTREECLEQAKKVPRICS